MNERNPFHETSRSQHKNIAMEEVPVSSNEENLFASRVQESVQVIDGICTQESIQCKQNSFGWNGQSGTNNLAPFNPNSGLITEVNQVPFYSQVMNHGASYFQLLQAQYHVNDPSSSRDEVNDQSF
ncbi:hypothetical protein P8452_52488 [Trifolium repens]|nr:hypothetical protein P8452_52488 [Trifolium repens]